MMMMMMKKKKKKEQSKSMLDLITNMSSSMSMFVQRKFCDKVSPSGELFGGGFFFFWPFVHAHLCIHGSMD